MGGVVILSEKTTTNTTSTEGVIERCGALRMPIIESLRHRDCHLQR
jgi:hypothetical protein